MFDEKVCYPLNIEELKIPLESGNYIICLKNGVKLPSHNELQDPVYTTFKGFDVLYTGIASNLFKRIIGNHIVGLGKSTFRVSLGVFISNSNDRTKWILENLIFFYCQNENAEEIEKIIINKYNPPFNLKHNTNPINQEFRRELGVKR
ncbi:MAG: GIY-YIG nuclease family protein [Flavobacteriia bacterium]|nr:GIY-YIG nuclease family protein [Flavobacteriia bacterium]